VQPVYFIAVNGRCGDYTKTLHVGVSSMSVLQNVGTGLASSKEIYRLGVNAVILLRMKCNSRRT